MHVYICLESFVAHISGRSGPPRNLPGVLSSFELRPGAVAEDRSWVVSSFPPTSQAQVGIMARGVEGAGVTHSEESSLECAMGIGKSRQCFIVYSVSALTSEFVCSDEAWDKTVYLNVGLHLENYRREKTIMLTNCPDSLCIAEACDLLLDSATLGRLGADEVSHIGRLSSIQSRPDILVATASVPLSISTDNYSSQPGFLWLGTLQEVMAPDSIHGLRRLPGVDLDSPATSALQDRMGLDRDLPLYAVYFLAHVSPPTTLSFLVLHPNSHEYSPGSGNESGFGWGGRSFE